VIGCAAATVFAAPARAQDSPVILEGADKDTLEAIRATLPEREKPETLFDAERLAEEAADRAEDWLRSEGYYAGMADPVATDSPPVARVTITTGSRFHFAKPNVNFLGAQLPADAESAVLKALGQIGVGAPARAADVLGAEQGILQTLRDKGYADAKTSPRSVVVDHATGEMSVTLAYETGDAIRLGDVRVKPATVLKDDFVEKLKTWREGDLYSESKLTALRRDISGTGAFDRVLVSLAPEADENGQRDVLVTLDEAKPRTIALGASYSTTEGAGVDGEWTRRNVSRRADSLTFSSTLAELHQGAGVEWFRPHAAGRGRAQRIGAELEHEDLEPYERSSATISAAIEAEPRLSFGASYGASLAYNDYSEEAGISNALILSTFYDVRMDRADSELDPRNGYMLQGRVEPSVSAGDATLAFVRTTAQARGYYSLGETDRTTFAGRLNLGWAQTLGGDAEDLPLDRRFYAGGGGSVRGYEYRSIYPTATAILTTEPPGGQGLLEVSAEARFRATDKLGAALFIDGGSAFNDFGEAGDLRWGAGVGLRYNLGFAPLRFDVAVPLDKRDADPDVAFYVSLGQAF
jgi:translocation and assembly module TamA